MTQSVGMNDLLRRHRQTSDEWVAEALALLEDHRTGRKPMTLNEMQSLASSGVAWAIKLKRSDTDEDVDLAERLPSRIDGWEVERGTCFNVLYRKGVYPNEYPLFYMSVNRYSGKVSLYRRRRGMAATEIEVTDDPTMLKAAAKWANAHITAHPHIATLAE